MKKITSVFLVLFLSFSLSACQKKEIASEDPQTIVNKAWEKQVKKQLESTKGTYAVEGEGKLSMDKSSAEIKGKGEVKFNNEKDQERFGVSLDMSGKGDLEGKTGNFDLKGELRWLQKKLFARFDKLALKTDDPQFNVMANLISNFYQSQWIEFPLEKLNPTLFTGPSSDQKNMAALIEAAGKNPFFDVVQDRGDRTFEVMVNPEKLITYLNAIREIQGGTEMPEAEAINKFFQDLKYQLQIRIDDNYNLTWIKMNGSAADLTTQQKADLSFESTIDDQGTDIQGNLSYSGKQTGSVEGRLKTSQKSKKASLDAPRDAKPFDLGGLFGGLSQE